MKGSDRNKKCPCGSGKKMKKCEHNDEKVPEEVIKFFSDLERDRSVLEKLGIRTSYQQSISKIKEGYLTTLDRRVFRIDSNIDLDFYDVLGVIAMDTLDNAWIGEQSKMDSDKRSYLYKLISLLAASSALSNVLMYQGKKRKKISFPEAGFSKDFLTLAFDLFCLRHANSLPDSLVERLKISDQYQGARYEIAISAIFVRLGYSISWIDDATIKSPEFLANKDDCKIYVEAKSRHIQGDQGMSGEFNIDKAMSSRGSGGLLYKALQKKVPSDCAYLIFVDVNAVDDDNDPPKWLKHLHKSIGNQHHKQFLEMKRDGMIVIFTNFSYHYFGQNDVKRSFHLIYNGDDKKDSFLSSEEFFEITNAIRFHGFVPDYHIPDPPKDHSGSSEYPRIKNIGYKRM